MTPSGIAPAATRRLTAVAVCDARCSRRASTPAVLGMPSSAIDSFTVNGTPSSGGSSSKSCAAQRDHCDPLVDGARLSARLLKTVRDDGVQAWVRLLEQFDMSFDHLTGGELSAVDRGRQVDG